MSADDILTQTFCIYCQKEFDSPRRLQTHVMMVHPDTYAASAIIAATKLGKS